MVDPRFFTSAGPLSITALTEKIAIEEHTVDIELSGVASLKEAGPEDLAFFSSLKLKDELTATRAAAVLVKAEHAGLVPNGCLALVCG